MNSPFLSRIAGCFFVPLLISCESGSGNQDVNQIADQFEQQIKTGMSASEVLHVLAKEDIQNSGLRDCQVDENCKTKITAFIRGPRKGIVITDIQYQFLFDEQSLLKGFNRDEVYTGP